jgi:glycosyltransferase involved in cell wall biosynthesis
VPDVSIVIPTRDSVELLRQVFDGLEAAHDDEVTYEIVVVDQASEDGTRELVAERGARLVRVDRPSLYAPPTRSRNVGAAVAEGEFLLHLDADMTIVPGTLRRGVDVCRQGGAVALVLEEIDVTEGFWAASKALERRMYRSTIVEGARFVSRSVFAAVGGYDETLGSGEDWDVHARYAALGGIGRVENAVRHHLGAISYRGQMRKKFLYGQSSASFLGKYDAREYSRAMLAAYARSWRELAGHPVLTAGFVALRAGETVALLSGSVAARRAGPPG